MKFSEVELPSNRKFGVFFSIIFLIGFYYFFSENSINIALICVFFSLVFFLTALIKAELLSPLNWLWMQLGFMLGVVVSPFILGIIFFGLFTPIAIFTRSFGRDELKLRSKLKNTHWIKRTANMEYENLKKQF